LGESSKIYSEIVDFQMSTLLDEAAAQRDGTLRKSPGFRSHEENQILTGPMLFVANPMFKQPRKGCKSHRDYEPLDLTLISGSFRQRTLFQPLLHGLEFDEKLPRSKWATNSHLAVSTGPTLTAFAKGSVRWSMGDKIQPNRRKLSAKAAAQEPRSKVQDPRPSNRSR
jgi:hypothetical protein